MRILLVEDEPDNRIIADMALRHAGHEVVSVRTGTGALTLCHEHDEHFDCVIMDLLLPGVDGFEAARRLRAHPATASLPIVACSALADSIHRVEALASGCDHYVIKPYRRDELLAGVHAAINAANARG